MNKPRLIAVSVGVLVIGIAINPLRHCHESVEPEQITMRVGHLNADRSWMARSQAGVPAPPAGDTSGRDSLARDTTPANSGLGAEGARQTANPIRAGGDTPAGSLTSAAVIDRAEAKLRWRNSTVLFRPRLPVAAGMTGGHDPDGPTAMAHSSALGDDVTYDSGPDVEFSTAARFQIPESGSIAGDAGTIAFEFLPEWSGDNQADADLIAIGDNRLRIVKNVHFLRFEMLDSSGTVSGTGVSIANWEPAEPHQVTATWGAGMMSLYLDGMLAAQEHCTNPIDIAPGTPVYVGTDSAGALVAPGRVSNVRLSNRSVGRVDP